MPARFRFRLEPLLRLRKSLEQDAQRRLAKEIESRNNAENALNTLKDNYKACIESRRSQPGEAIDLLQWSNLERFLEEKKKRILHAEEDLKAEIEKAMK